MTDLSQVDKLQGVQKHLALAIKARDPLVDRLSGGVDFGFNNATKFSSDTSPDLTKYPVGTYSWQATMFLHHRPSGAATAGRNIIFFATNGLDFFMFFHNANDRLTIYHAGAQRLQLDYIPPVGRIFRLAGHWTGREFILDEDGQEVERRPLTTALAGGQTQVFLCSFASQPFFAGHMYEFWLDRGADIDLNRDRGSDVLTYDAAVDTDLLFGWKFRELAGTTVADETGNSTLTLSGSPPWITAPDSSRMVYLSTSPLAGVKAKDLATDIRPTFYDATDDPEARVKFLPLLDISGAGFVEDVGAGPTGQDVGGGIGGNAFSARALIRAVVDQTPGTPVDRYALDALARLRYKGRDAQVWRYAETRRTSRRR